jgi:HSP20 family protein
MSLQNIIPWNWGRKSLPIKKEPESYYQPVESEHEVGGFGTDLAPYASFHSEINRVFDDFFRSFWGMDFGVPGSGGIMPANTSAQRAWTPQLDVVESDNEYRVTAELPGLSEKDIDLSVTKDVLTLKGEKQFEKKENVKGYYRCERSYGSFHRSIQLPGDVDVSKIDANFRNGVLEIKLPKDRAQRDLRSIPIRHG